MSFTGEVVGDISPHEVIQQDTRACLPACLLAEIDPTLDLSEADIVEVMTEDGLFNPDPYGGTSLYPARVLDKTVEKIGLTISPVFEARLQGDAEVDRAAGRIVAVDEALHRGEHVILAYPKRRDGEAPFLHYSLVTGYEVTPEEARYALLTRVMLTVG